MPSTWPEEYGLCPISGRGSGFRRRPWGFPSTPRAAGRCLRRNREAKRTEPPGVARVAGSPLPCQPTAFPREGRTSSRVGVTGRELHPHGAGHTRRSAGVARLLAHPQTPARLFHLLGCLVSPVGFALSVSPALAADGPRFGDQPPRSLIPSPIPGVGSGRPPPLERK